MFLGKLGDGKEEKIIEGVTRRLLTTGEKIQVFMLEMKGGTPVPEHSHPHEQAGYIIQGVFEVNIGGQKGILKKDGCFRIPSNTPHSGYVHEDTFLLDVYSPPRSE
jgi:quercetin dioxygenase-like cupin family protein